MLCFRCGSYNVDDATACSVCGQEFADAKSKRVRAGTKASDNGALNIFTPGEVVASPASYYDPAISPDGKWISYIAYPEGTLWMMRRDTTDAIQLTFAPFRVDAHDPADPRSVSDDPTNDINTALATGRGVVIVPVDVLPGWMQPLANISPVYYALNGIRETLMNGASFGSQWDNIWPLLIMGAVFPPLGLWLFHAGEMFAKRTGRLKRSG